MGLTFGSLFTGIGGIDLGLERAGLTCVWQVEIDNYARRILTKYWPDVPKYGDIRGVDFTLVEPVDVLAGGFPCQDLSLAPNGPRAGLAGTRSGLWVEFERAICVLRPRYIFVENVPDLLSNGFGAVLGFLAEQRYDAEWSVLSACSLGAPHTRERLFLVAYANGKRGNGIGIASNGLARNQWAKTNLGAQSQRTTARPRAITRQWAAEPDMGRVAYGVPARVDRLRGLGNAVVPQLAELIGWAIRAYEEAH